MIDNHDVDYTLPLKHNRGKPPNRYSLDFEERRFKYLIENYVLVERLSKVPLKIFNQNLSLHHVLDDINEALIYPKWTQAI